MQNRRQFFKTLGIGFVALQVVPSILLKDKYAHFDPSEQYGDWVATADCFTKKSLKVCLDELDKQIVDVIPPKYRKRVVYMGVNPRPIDPYGESGFLAWKSISINRKMPLKRLAIN